MPADRSRSAAAIARYLAQLPAEQRGLVERLRQLVRRSMPRTEELLYHGALGYAPTGQPVDRLVYILPAARHVTLGFFFGVNVPDPAGVLEGAGKRMRHVKVRTVTDTEDPRLARLLRAAHRDGPSSPAGLHARWGTSAAARRGAPGKRSRMPAARRSGARG